MTLKYRETRDPAACYRLFDYYSRYYTYPDNTRKAAAVNDLARIVNTIEACREFEVSRAAGKVHLEIAMLITGFDVHRSGFIAGVSLNGAVYAVVTPYDSGASFMIDPFTASNTSYRFRVPYPTVSKHVELDKRARLVKAVRALELIFGRDVSSLALGAIREGNDYYLSALVDVGGERYSGDVIVDELLFKVVAGNTEHERRDGNTYVVWSEFKSYEEMVGFAREVEEQYIALKAMFG